jgi:threonine dehydrogenase-like Zn-dependent dehydrogenase
VAIIGTIQEPMTGLIPGQFSPQEPNFQFSFTYTQEDVQIYLDMVASGKMHFPGMVTDVVSLEHAIDQGLDRKDRKGMLKILIDPSL